MERKEKDKNEVRREGREGGEGRAGEGRAHSPLLCSVSPFKQDNLRVCLLGLQGHLRLASLCSSSQSCTPSSQSQAETMTLSSSPEPSHC